MKASNSPDDSMNFSVIDHNEHKEGHMDFSVQSLLENNENAILKREQDPPDPHISRQNIFNKVKKMQQNSSRSIIYQIQSTSQKDSQQFLRDLSRMEKQLSYEAESYNIFEDPLNNSVEVIQNNKSKTLSYLKVTKQYTNKSISKENLQDFNDYYGDLIISFDLKDIKNKEKAAGKNDSKNISKNLSSQHSCQSLSKRQTDKKGSNINNFYRLKDLKYSSKNKLPQDLRKSKPKISKLKACLPNSKSHSQLKTSIQGETFKQKVFTEYYGTEVKFYPQKKETRKKKETNSNAKPAKDKSSKSKLSILSPKMKHSSKALAKK